MKFYYIIGDKNFGKRIFHFSALFLLLYGYPIGRRSVYSAAQNIFFHLPCDFRMLCISKPNFG